MRLVLGTTNKGKVREIEDVLRGLPVVVESIGAYELPPVVEDGETFTDNACKKARYYATHTGYIAIADDSGLEVDALQGQPGVCSARYAGEKANDEMNNDKLLKALHDTPAGQRTARFRCVLAVAAPDGRCATTEGVCDGTIALSPRGDQGFGYDPLFILDDGRTMAELPVEEKNRISHRGQALRKLKELLQQFREDT
jgi:XTP/dITP diphosphohydrolase